MLNFTNKKEIFEYIKKKFNKESKLILVRGSTATKSAKKFSDFDTEVYKNKTRKPYYEIILLKEKPVLISVYFYKFKQGKKCKSPINIKIIHGNYNSGIKADFNKDTYIPKEKIKRECQLVTDFLFKYLRSKNKKYLELIQKRIKD